jgi:hypothetical protein
VIADPAGATLSPGESVTFAVTARAKDGAPVGGPADVAVLDGTVDPDAPFRLVAGQAHPVRFTMGDRDLARVVISVTSRRGKGSLLIEIPRTKGWDVTFKGAGTYSRTWSEVSDTNQMTGSFSWETAFTGVRFDGTSYDPFGSSSISGTLAQDGTLGTGHYSCTGPPSIGSISSLTFAPAAGGALDVHILAFAGVVVAPGQEQCTRVGYGGDYGHVDAILHTSPYDAFFRLPPELLARDEFTVPVQRARDFPANCDEETATCTESGDYTGTVRFVRRG